MKLLDLMAFVCWSEQKIEMNQIMLDRTTKPNLNILYHNVSIWMKMLFALYLQKEIFFLVCTHSGNKIVPINLKQIIWSKKTQLYQQC